MATGWVEVAVVTAGYGCTVLLGWIRARAAAQISRDRGTRRHELVRALPAGSRVVEFADAGIIVEVGRRPAAPSPTGSGDELRYS